MRSGKKFTLGFLPTLFCLVAMLVSACGGSNSTGPTGTGQPAPAPATQQVLKYAFALSGSDINTFDPALDSDAPSAEAIDMIFTGLVQLNDKLEVTPQIAKSWDVSSDNLTYTFHLKTGLKFSDGTALTATDVAYSIDRALSPAIANQSGVTQTYLGLIKDSDKRIAGKLPTVIGDSVKVIDDNTISITVVHATGYFLEALTYPTSYVVERKVIDQWKDKWTDHLGDNGGQGGAGPFKVQSYSHTTGIIFVSNPNYYGAIGKLQRVEFNFYKSADAAYAAYQANQGDLSSVPGSKIPQARLLPNGQYRQNPQLTIDYLAMNFLYPPFNNIHIRQAFSAAINRDIINTSINHGTRPATCHIVPSGMPGYDPNLTCAGGAPTSGDPAKAQALLKQGLQEEGWSSVSQMPPIKITYEANAPTLDSLITTMRQMWQQVLGVNVTVQTLDFAPFVNAINANPCTKADLHQCLGKGLQMWAIAWLADYPDPQDWLTLQFDKGAPNNNGNFGQNLGSDAAAEQQLQQQMEQADVDTNQTTRMQTYNTVEQQLVNDVAWLSYDQRFGVAVVKPYVVGITFNAFGLRPPDAWANIYIAQH